MLPPLEILLVEDNQGDVEMARHALRKSGANCRLSVVNDGQEALDYLARREGFADSTAPHVILLDLNMPRIDGKQFLEIAKADETMKAIPVVMFTSSQSPTDIRECYERHASSYVVKPFGGMEFVDVLNRMVDYWGSTVRLA